jgi:hypothetical protein
MKGTGPDDDPLKAEAPLQGLDFGRKPGAPGVALPGWFTQFGESLGTLTKRPDDGIIQCGRRGPGLVPRRNHLLN